MNNCNCGGHHHEEHNCGCGEHHHEEHNCDCGEHHHEHTHQIPVLTAEEIDFLVKLKVTGKLPVTRYVITSTKTDHFTVTALAPVYITSENETMDDIKCTGNLLQILYEDGFIDFAYGEALADFDYNIYEISDTFKYFVETIEESKNNPNFLGDTPILEKGFMQITIDGIYVLEANQNIK